MERRKQNLLQRGSQMYAMLIYHNETQENYIELNYVAALQRKPHGIRPLLKYKWSRKNDNPNNFFRHAFSPNIAHLNQV